MENEIKLGSNVIVAMFSDYIEGESTLLPSISRLIEIASPTGDDFVWKIIEMVCVSEEAEGVFHARGLRENYSVTIKDGQTVGWENSGMVPALPYIGELIRRLHYTKRENNLIPNNTTMRYKYRRDVVALQSMAVYLIAKVESFTDKELVLCRTPDSLDDSPCFDYVPVMVVADRPMNPTMISARYAVAEFMEINVVTSSW